MKKIGIMGGTFNPVHNAHLQLAVCAKEQYSLDAVIFMTSGNPPHKKHKDIPEGKIRLEMLKIAISGKEDFFADDFEVKSKEYSYSVNTMKYLREKYPQSELYFIIGGDSLRGLPEWYKPEELVKLCKFLVYPRGGTDIDDDIYETVKKYGGEIYPLQSPVIGISSTEIRERMVCGKDVSEMLPKGVLEYIKEHRLYTEDGEV